MSKHPQPRLRPIDSKVESRRKYVETFATFGLVLLAVGLLVPFASLVNAGFIAAFKWVFAAGALIYTIARVVNVNDPKDSTRLKRLRRMEAWAGIAFCIAAFFWFYNECRLKSGGSLFILRETITFTLVGAMIQIIASWMIVFRDKKERSLPDNDKG